VLAGVIVGRKPWIDKRFLNIDGPHFLMFTARLIAGRCNHRRRLFLTLSVVPLLFIFLRLTLPASFLLLLVSFLRLLFLLQSFLLHFLLLLQLELPFSLFVSLLLFNQSIANLLGQVEVHGVVFDEPGESLPAIVDLAQLYEQGNEVKQLSILRVIVPRDDGHRTFWLQHVGRWGIVQNYCVFHISADLRHVLCENSVDVGAVFSEEAH
jgi:hypothetical protein